MLDLAEWAVLHPQAALRALWDQGTVAVWLRAGWLIAFSVVATVAAGVVGRMLFQSKGDPEVPPTKRPPLRSPDPKPSREPWPKPPPVPKA